MENFRSKSVLLLLIVAIAIAPGIKAQEKYIEKDGVIIFEASEKLFEEVKAVNASVTAIFNSQTNQIASLALIKGFQFKNSLMEEHFNENYIESWKHPKATFKGRFPNLDIALLNQTSKKFKVEGTLKLHGKEKVIHTELAVQKIGDIISMTGEFIVTPGDFDIDIPKIVQNKIAKEVHVKIDFKLIKNE